MARLLFTRRTGKQQGTPIAIMESHGTARKHRPGGFVGDLNNRGVANEVKGAAKEMKGKVRGDLGDAMDNASEHIKGRAEQVEGKIQKNFGRSQQDSDPENNP
jgi:uncharacterized protein YjbJ (UPF0337 family)